MKRQNREEAIQALRNTLDRCGQVSLVETKGVSRGVETYGYNILSIKTVGGVRLASCNGGGYDMDSTVKANALCEIFQVELQEFFAGVNLSNNHSGDCKVRQNYCIYCAKDGQIHADGGGGSGVVRRLLQALGLQLIETRINSKTWALILQKAEHGKPGQTTDETFGRTFSTRVFDSAWEANSFIEGDTDGAGKVRWGVLRVFGSEEGGDLRVHVARLDDKGV